MYLPRTPHREAGLEWEIKAAWLPCVLEVPEGEEGRVGRIPAPPLRLPVCLSFPGVQVSMGVRVQLGPGEGGRG